MLQGKFCIVLQQIDEYNGGNAMEVEVEIQSGKQLSIESLRS